MARQSTLPGPWLDLARAVGGIQALCSTLGWPYMVMFRRTRGLVKIPKADRMLIDQISKQHSVKSPLVSEDLAQLELLGSALSKGFPPAKSEMTRVSALYPTDELIKLAEAENISENVLLAVTHLLSE